VEVEVVVEEEAAAAEVVVVVVVVLVVVDMILGMSDMTVMTAEMIIVINLLLRRCNLFVTDLFFNQ